MTTHDGATLEKEIARRMERFERVCRSAGVKLTHQRMEIFREVARTVEHPDAETVFRGVRERLPTVALDTVYRTLWLLVDLNLVTTLGSPRERTRFDANLCRHHHFVCVRCGLTRDLGGESFDALADPRALAAVGCVETVRVEVQGVCAECAAQEASRSSEQGDETPG